MKVRKVRNLMNRTSYINYLSNAEGIGEATANNIIVTYETKTKRRFSIITLKEWVGNKKITATDISANLKNKLLFFLEEEAKTDFSTLYFTELKLNPWKEDIMEIWGAGNLDKALERIEENPYDLISMFQGIGFNKADRIGLKLGFRDTAERKLAQCEYLVKTALHDTGDTYTTYERLQKAFYKIYWRASDCAFQSIVQTAFDNGTLISIDGKITTRNLYNSEKIIAEYFLHQRESQSGYLHIHEVKDKLESCLEEYELSETQKEAVIEAVSENVFLLTGGPGTGKTRTSKAIIECFELTYPDKTIIPLTFTGVAKERLSQMIGREARTIHSYIYSKDEFDAVLIDEAGMVSSELMAKLIEKKSPTTIYLVGDENQLKSIDPGDVFQNLLDYDNVPYEGHFPQYELHEVFRQEEESDIVQFSYRLNRNPEKAFEEHVNSSFFRMQYSEHEETPQKLEYAIELLKRNGISQRDLQLLTFSNKEREVYNNLLQELYNPASESKEEIKVGKIVLREGDKILYTINNSTDGVVNGKIGYITRIEPSQVIETEDGEKKRTKRKVTFMYPGNFFEHTIEESDIYHIQLAYALTVHKAQGSEYNTVVFVSNGGIYLTKRLVYVACTRAKENLLILGNIESIKRACMVEERKRSTRLIERLDEN